MTQHVRRMVARVLPAARETTIPLSTAIQARVESVSILTLRFGTTVSVGAIGAAAMWPHSFPARLLAAVLACAACDRSGFTRIRVRRSH